MAVFEIEKMMSIESRDQIKHDALISNSLLSSFSASCAAVTRHGNTFCDIQRAKEDSDRVRQEYDRGVRWKDYESMSVWIHWLTFQHVVLVCVSVLLTQHWHVTHPCFHSRLTATNSSQHNFKTNSRTKLHTLDIVQRVPSDVTASGCRLSLHHQHPALSIQDGRPFISMELLTCCMKP